VTLDAQASESQVFERILCGVDGTPASLVAVRQALRLQGEHGSFSLVAVANFARAAQAGMAATHAAELLQHEAHAALAEAQAIAPSASSTLVDGNPAGSRGLHGLKALGSVSERVAHQARSSVLVVRPGPT
jgi:nucleotide-binding universal stress UspA family protein